MFINTDNDIMSLNFCYYNMKNKNILFIIKIFKDKKVSDFKEKIKKKLRPINHNDFLCQIYPTKNPI